MEVVRATAREAAAVAELWLRSREASVPAIPPSVHTDDEVRAFVAEVVVPSKETWVVVDDAGVVGMLVLEDDFVDHLYVHPEHTGQLIGSGLLDHAKSRRPSGLQLWTFESNAGARRF